MELEENNLDEEVKDFNSGSSATDNSEDSMDIEEIPNKYYDIEIYNFQYAYSY